MTKIPPPRIRMVIAALALAGVTTTLAADPTASLRRLTALGYERGQPVEILPNDVIDHWDYLDNSTVIVHSGAGGHYLVSLTTECPALASASLISFNSAITGGMIASSTLVVGSSANAPECAIGQILQLNRRSG